MSESGFFSFLFSRGGRVFYNALPDFENKETRIVLVRFDSFPGGGKMLNWAIIFLVIALVAAVFGFGGIAVAAAGIAKFLFFLFLVMCLIFFILSMSAGRRGP
jgi:uncharacterized membrane protein YtjA (UPF0391 family)